MGRASWLSLSVVLSGLWACGESLDRPEPGLAEAPLISRTDGRASPDTIADAAFAAQARGFVAALVSTSSVQQDGSGNPYLAALPLYDRHEQQPYAVELCRDERFASEPTPALCTATLIAPDLVLTAGHCVSASNCASTSIVFGFEADAAGEVAPLAPADIYACQSVLVRSAGAAGAADYAVLRLDRAAAGRTPATMLRDVRSLPLDTELTIAGHPLGLPLKISEGGVTKPLPSGYAPQAPQYFAVDGDAFPGSSGSAAFLTQPGGSHALAGVVSSFLDVSEYWYDAQRDCDRYERWSFTTVWASHAHVALSALCATLPAATYPELCGCGNGTCDPAAGEDGTVCATDCGGDACGDGACLGAESPSTCAADCGACGDGTCSAGEDCCDDCGCGAGRECDQHLCVPDLEIAGADCEHAIDLAPLGSYTLNTPTGAAACYRFTLPEARYVRWQGNATQNAPVCSNPQCVGGNNYGPSALFAAGTYWLALAGDNASPRTYEVTFESTLTRDGRSCDAAISIPTTSASANVQGTTSGGWRSLACPVDQTYSCFARDRFYTFTLAAPASVSVVARGFAHLALVLRAGQCTGGAPVEVAIDRSGRGQTRFERVLPAGTYQLAVDGEDAFDVGAFELDIDFESPPVASGDDCSDPITLDPHGAYSVAGDTTLAANDAGYDAGNTCNVATFGNDRYYAFTLTEKTRVDISVTAAHRVALRLERGSCDTDLPLRCERGVSGISRVLDPGTYTLAVDGEQHFDNGPYMLELAFTASPPPTGESCEDALVLDPNGEHRLIGNVYSASNDAYAPCQTGSRGDHVYTFTLAERRTVRVTGTGAQRVYLDVGASCPTTAGRTCLGLAAEPRSVNQTLEPGTYYVVIDAGPYATSGDYDVTVDFESAPAGESCLDPLPITLTATPATFSAPATSNGAAAYVAYGFTLAQPSRLEVEAAEPANLDIQASTGGYIYPPGEELTANVPAATYCAVLSGQNSTPTLSMTASATALEAPDGRGCADAIPLTVPGTHELHGYTSFGTMRYCGGEATQLYRFVLTEPTATRIMATDGFVLALYGDAACTSFRNCTSGLPPVIDDLRLEAGTYTLQVSGPPLVPYELHASFDCDPDDDGVCSAGDVCPYNANKITSAGQCGCTYLTEPDSDADGVANCVDACPIAAGPVAGCPVVEPPDASAPDATLPDPTDAMVPDAMMPEPDATAPDATAPGDGDGDEDAGRDEDAGHEEEPEPPIMRDAAVELDAAIVDRPDSGVPVPNVPLPDSGMNNPTGGGGSPSGAEPDASAEGSPRHRSGCACSTVAPRPPAPLALAPIALLTIAIVGRRLRRARRS